MRKNVFGKQLKRDKNERTALFKGLMSSLVLNESIKTTETKAKAIRGEVEKLVTRAKKETNLAKKLLGKKLTPKAIEKMIREIAPRFKNRPGGYTRMVKLGKRFGDHAQVVIIEWVEKAKIEPVVSTQQKGKPKKTENLPSRKASEGQEKKTVKKAIKKKK